ncbi:MAG TPA: hypothetical protein VNM67_13230 [Thermoanaerobaculia bacterium]|jgi:hypothetical protein|nr:hypothetical protein [Thermoanaerobaculia bacterium]
MTPGENLDEVRSELRRLGYLDHGFERFLLQDAMRPRAPLRTVVYLTARVALLAGGVSAAALALALVAANGSFSSSPLDVVAIFLHLFPPISFAAGLGFLALCGVVLLVIRLYHVKRIEAVSLAAAAAAGAAALGLVLLGARELVHEGNRTLLVVLALAAPLAVAVLVRLVYQGLLTLAIRFTDTTPQTRLFSRRGLGIAIVAAAFLLTVPAVQSVRREPVRAPATLPMSPGDRVLLLGIDGVLPEELDYLLAVGDLPTLGRLAREGGRVFRYTREDEPPASFWTAVATGIPGPDHGVTSLDSFRPLGVETPLARNVPVRLWWSRVEVPLGLAEYRPVLANRRRAFAVWELASRGGSPVLSVNWWGTFPAEPLPGLVVAHGAFQLLEEGTRGAIAPESEKKEAENLVRRTRIDKGREPRLAAALPPAALASVLQRALLPDRFYRRVFEERLAGAGSTQPKAAALYLPGLDIAADGWSGGDVAFTDLVRAELSAADALLGRALPGFGTVVVLLDPGRRRAGSQGRVLIWRRVGCSGRGGEIEPEAVASGLLRALGLPQSGELPPPPAGCRWAPAQSTVPGYGEPRQGRGPSEQGEEYLKSLRSLGYL